MKEYGFVDRGLNYNDLDNYQKFKADWLEEVDYYSDNTKTNYWGLLNGKVHPTEEILGKNLHDFDKQEIVKLVKYTESKKPGTKAQLFTAISRYMEWACDKGYNYVGNPCDTIEPKDILTVNELAYKERYIELQKFHDFVFDLNCSDVDRALLTLLRYGVKVGDVGKVKWEDIDAERKILRINHIDEDNEENNSILELPIDHWFLMIIEKAKACESRQKQMKVEKELNKESQIVNYVDYGYIIKALKFVGWKFMDSATVYNRVSVISKANGIQRISVPDLNEARKYDLLFDIVDKTDNITSDDVEDVLKIFELNPTYSKLNRLRNDFELLSQYPVERNKPIPNSRTKKDYSFENEHINKKQKETKLENDFIDDEDDNYQKNINKNIDENVDISTHTYKPKPKDKEKDEYEGNCNSRKSNRNPMVGRLALKLANYQCELDETHETFISNTTSENYVEAHHLIPMKYYDYDEFKVSIDNEANIVALCPTCHRKIHFGQPEEKEKILRTLYDANIDNLRDSGIEITFKRLLQMYIECSNNKDDN